MPDIRNTYARERAYYLPRRNSKLAQQWTAKEDQQAAYADLCRRGHTIIANQIIEGRNNGHPPTIEDLYKTAARVRRAMAAVLGNTHNQAADAESYGQPVGEGAHIRDFVNSNKEHTYSSHFRKAAEDYEKLLSHIANAKKIPLDSVDSSTHRYVPYLDDYTQYDLGETFGEGYVGHIHYDRRDDVHEITITHPRVRNDVAHLDHITGSSLAFTHATDHTALLGMANEHFTELLASRTPEKFWQELGAVSLDLFHAAPLHRGTQTANLMVLAGIMKAMGYTPGSRKDVTGHFIKAELTPYKRYIQEYKDTFTRIPVQGEIPRERLPVDDSFIKASWEKIREHLAEIPDLKERAQSYLHYRTILDRFEVTDLRVRNGKVAITVVPAARSARDTALDEETPADRKARFQTRVNELLDFVGHDEVINSLGLRHIERASTGRSAPRKGR